MKRSRSKPIELLGKVILDGSPSTPISVMLGAWRVSYLKEKLGVNQALVLALVKPFGLQDLDEDQIIEVKNRDRFVSHARSGAHS